VLRLEGHSAVADEIHVDRLAILEQLGLEVVLQPPSQGPVRFGTSVYRAPRSSARVGAVALTWIDVRSDDEAHEVEAITGRQVMPELVQTPGFLSALLARAGDRMFTVSAWESADAAARLMRSRAHGAAVRRFLAGGLGTAVHTGVWTAHRLNALWIRCDACAAVVDVDASDGRCPCGAAVVERPRW
jgi:heme-degrading monooxygenase HmoA